MIAVIHRRGNLIPKGFGSRTNPRESKIYRAFQRTKNFIRVPEFCHRILDVTVNDILWVPVIYKDILDSSKFILNLALTTNVKSSVRKTSN